MLIEETDNEEEINQMINEQKNDKAKNKKILIIISVSIVILIILSITIFFIIKIIKDKNKNKDLYDTNPLIVEPTDKYLYCLIFLHGLNDSAEHFQSYFQKINFSKKNSTKMIFLRAPKANITYKNKKNVTSWFDINIPLNSTKDYNFTDATKSKNILNEIIIKEAKLLNGNYNKIIIGGHSQGACISLYAGYSADYLLGGVISLSGILFEEVNIKGNKNELKVFLNHGGLDTLIPLNYHNQTVKRIINYSGVKKYYYETQTHFFERFPKVGIDLEGFLNQTMI